MTNQTKHISRSQDTHPLQVVKTVPRFRSGYGFIYKGATARQLVMPDTIVPLSV